MRKEGSRSRGSTSENKSASGFLQQQPKYRVAKDVPGSGNTKNIGAVNTVDELVNGRGPFAELGEEVFDDYWMYYLTSDMARAVELEKPPYINLGTYLEYKGKGKKG